MPEPSQTLLVPQPVPADRLPKSWQTGAPVVQLMIPVLHGVGFVEQFMFAMHPTQAPAPSQTLSVAQVVPGALLAPSVQVIAPVEHDVVPLLHAFALVVHGWLGLHETQAPAPSQTLPTPQLVPGAVLVVPSMQVVMLPLHVVFPCLHAVGLPVQVWFAVQMPQNPLPSQVGPPGHGVVLDFGVPSTQTDAPVSHAVTPLRQTDGLLVQVVPAVHGTQVPVPLQTWLVPQDVPAGVLPESRQTGAPVLQSMTPVLHGAPGFMLHALPASHATQAPLPLQTMFEPQAVPPPTLSPSLQPGDIPHVTMPSLHIPPGLLVQTVPAAQFVHMPVLQTLSTPHDIPSVASPPSTHCGAPVSQATTPFLHAPPLLVEHEAPAAHATQVPVALQTCPVPQASPGPLAVPFVHPAVGAQTTTPFLHESLLVAQGDPAEQALQTPLAQSWLLPQGVPSLALAPSSQVRPSAPQTIRPSRHGAFLLVVHASVGHADPSCGPASKLPELTAASTMLLICSGVRPFAQPGMRQQTPIVTDAESICSQL
jgi:hypothetical protein